MQAFQDGRFAEALHGWMADAASGDGAAARYVGILYDTGEGVQRSPEEALHWYRQAADLGDVPAMFNVAVCYDSGICAPQDPAEAARWYRRAAAHRFGRAEYNLALITSAGDGVPRNQTAAQVLFRHAREDGIEAAAAHLTSAAPSPVQSQPSPPATVHKAAQPAPIPAPASTQAHAAAPAVSAQDKLFMAAQRQLLTRTPAAAVAAAGMLAQAAARSGPDALMASYDLAWCYENGVGVPKDRHQAYVLFTDVASRTDDASLRGLAQDGAKAVRGYSVKAQASPAP